MAAAWRSDKSTELAEVQSLIAFNELQRFNNSQQQRFPRFVREAAIHSSEIDFVTKKNS